MDKKYTTLIRQEFVDCATNTLARVEKSLTNPDRAGNHKPFHEAILIPEAILWSKFERSFSTSFGQRLVEEVSRLVALAYGVDDAQKQHVSTFHLNMSLIDAIEQHVDQIREGQIRGQWKNDLATIANKEQSGGTHKRRVISDLWFVRNGVENFFSIKTVKPNIDQTLEAKRDLLKIKLYKPEANVYYGLYYNPWGENRADYKHNPPMKVFDFLKDEVVLIGKDYWDTVGADGAYQILLEIAEDAGKETKSIIETFARQLP